MFEIEERSLKHKYLHRITWFFMLDVGEKLEALLSLWACLLLPFAVITHIRVGWKRKYLHDGEKSVGGSQKKSLKDEKVKKKSSMPFSLIISNYAFLPVAQKSCHYSDGDNVVEKKMSELGLGEDRDVFK